ncbi:MAG: carbon-nitrogen hydrolase family protein [Polyangiaceae bacterium]
MRLILTGAQLRHAEGAENLHAIERALEASGITPAPEDVLLLPERVLMTHSANDYVEAVRGLARKLGCHLVAGSHHEATGEAEVNSGVALDPGGSVLGRYEKLRPYALERLSVRPGTGLGELRIAGRRFLVLICADFWFSDLFHRARDLPDVVLVPALSVSRKATPDYSRSLWRHLAITRAYEMGAYVGVSDWGHPSELPLLATSGVGGFADPTETDPERFFTPIPESGALAVELDFDSLEAFRDDRRARGFFWKDHDP